MKKLLILFFICVCLLSMQAQKRYVVAFDCTKSMNHPDGDYTDNGLDDSKLWKPAKDCIHSLWTQASPSDEFYILLFQDNVLEIVKGCKGTQLKDWNSIESRMNEAIKKGGNTCIFRAWQTAEQYFTDNCDFYFITDGVEDHDNNNQINDDEQAHIDAICKKIDEFCNLGINGFYTNLKQSENDIINNQISRKIKESCFKDLIAGSITPLKSSLDQEDINKGKKTFNLTFEPIDKQRLANIKSLEVRFDDSEDNDGLRNADSYFKLGISGIKNNNIKLTIEQIKAVPQELLDTANSCMFYLNISSNDKDVAIFPQRDTIKVSYYYEKIAFLPTQELVGESKYHSAFFIKPLANLFSGCDIIAEHKPDTIKFDLKDLLNDKILFNKEAIKHGSSYKMRFVPIRDKDKKSKFIVLKNGEICKNNTIEVYSSDNNLVINVVFEKSSSDGTFKFKLVPIESKDLDKINECVNISEASIPVFLKFDIHWNPLELLVLFVFCSWLLVTLFFYMWKNCITKKMFGIDVYLMPNRIMPIATINGCVKIVITSKRKTERNHFLHKVYNGPIAYINVPNADSGDIVIFEEYNGDLNVKTNMNYLLNNMPIIGNMQVQRGVVSSFDSCSDGKNFQLIIT